MPEAQDLDTILRFIPTFGQREVLDKGMLSAFLAEEQRVLDLSLSNDFGNAQEITSGRTKAVDNLLREVAKRLSEGYDGPFLFAAAGGYGRQELTPASDLDQYMLVPDMSIGQTKFLERFRHVMEVIFERVPGMSATQAAITKTISDLWQSGNQNYAAADFHGLMSLIDLRPIIGNGYLAQEVQKALFGCDVVELYAKIMESMRLLRKEHPNEIDDLSSFDVKNGKGGRRDLYFAALFDGFHLRLGTTQTYGANPPDVAQARETLIRLKAWINAYHLTQGCRLTKDNRRFNRLGLNECREMENHFGSGTLDRLMQARRIASHYLDVSLQHRLSEGVLSAAGPVLGLDGLHLGPDNGWERGENIYRLFELSQRVCIPLSPAPGFVYGSTKYHPKLLDIFAGSMVSASLKGLNDWGILRDAWPGHALLESQYLEKCHRHHGKTHQQRGIERLQNLENILGKAQIEAEGYESRDREKFRFLADNAIPDREEMLALNITLYFKAVPGVRGIAPAEYLRQMYKNAPQISRHSRSLLNLLFTQPHIFHDYALRPRITDRTFKNFFQGLGRPASDIKSKLKCLFLYTAADRDFSPTLMNPQEMQAFEFYRGALHMLKNGNLPVQHNGSLDAETLSFISSHFPPEFLWSKYHSEAPEIANRIMEGKIDTLPYVRVSLVQHEPPQYRVKVICPDSPGLFWRLASTFLKDNANIHNADVYSIGSDREYALDYFDVTGECDMRQLERDLQRTIQLHRAPRGLKSASELLKEVTLADLQLTREDDDYILSFKTDDRIGLLYAVTRLLSEKGRANITGLSAFTGKDMRIQDQIAFVSPYSHSRISRLFSYSQ